ncbi:MAG: MaoC family dehydratase [Candidatus Thorarchaeota archaeon]|nr:MaoC family dehydratase [Candidatus Thorarchaeota archaeon]
MDKVRMATYSEIQVGQWAEITHTVTDEDIRKFGELSGDFNPLHFNHEWAETTMFKGRIAHGILTAAYISAVIGMKLPGAGTIYLGQSMKFRRPVRIGDTITAHVEVVAKDDERQRITLATTCTNQDREVVLDGEAVVSIMRA